MKSLAPAAFPVFLFFTSLPGDAMAQDSPYEKAEFKADGKTLPYRLLKPAAIEKGKSYPLVVFLHGAGERGADNTAQLIHGSSLFTSKAHRADFPCFVVFPQCPAGQRWVEVDWGEKKPHAQPKKPGAAMLLTRQLVGQLMKHHPIDTQRVYVMGLSMGGFGTWDFAARYPDLVAAIVPICGGADDRTAAKLKSVPAWVFHGAKDTAVWPARSRSMVEALKKAGGTVRYTEYPKVGHDSWNHAFREPELLPWLFAQRKR